MAVARFSSITECHNQLSRLVKLVNEDGLLVIITHHGSPKYALLPLAELPEYLHPDKGVGVRVLAKEFHQYLKKIEDLEGLYITAHNRPIAQLISIEPDDVDDMIILASRQLQQEAGKYSTPEAAASLKSGSALLNELKALRVQASSKDREMVQ